MQVVTTVAELRQVVAGFRERGGSIGLVPTMGYLHQGHLALVDRCRQKASRTVVSIFVNPLQFGPQEDLGRYPRDFERDRRLLEERDVDLVFAPTVDAMYPEPPIVRVDPGPLADRWEGAVRPGHFAGVLTVVAKLFHQVMPDVVCFGQKDIQQVTLVRRMLRDLDWPIELIVVPTMREPDGLALSSRNVYLSAVQRRDGLALSQALGAVRSAWQDGLTDAAALRQRAEDVFRERPAVVVDYIAIVDPERLEPVMTAIAGTVVAVAARVGSTRLIDNVILGSDPV